MSPIFNQTSPWAPERPKPPDKACTLLKDAYPSKQFLLFQVKSLQPKKSPSMQINPVQQNACYEVPNW